MATITYTVTVATGTTQYGTGDRYYINGELAPVLYLQEGNTYIFDQADTSNDTHQIAFSTNPNNSPVASYTTGVTTVGTPGNAGAAWVSCVKNTVNSKPKTELIRCFTLVLYIQALARYSTLSTLILSLQQN